MIESFGNRLAEDLFFDRQTKETRRFPAEWRRVARRKVLYLHDATELGDLKVPAGSRLESIKRRLTGLYSIRVNAQWRGGVALGARQRLRRRSGGLPVSAWRE